MNGKAANNANATIAFTLPISCQICLEKVKQPVVCPNQHVFCSPCLDIWLERNDRCPACRVPITAENPCRQVLGGLNPQTDKGENFSCRELRRARMELIYKDYESEIERLEADLEAAKQMNKELRQRVRSADAQSHLNKSPSSPQSVTSEHDRSTISLLNTKIKDATALYDEVKTELSGFKKENTWLKEQLANSTRENQTLRLELANRSPRRYGRCTVAALETKLDTSERQIKQLQKALEKSDSYIEDLEKEIETLRSGNPNSCASCKAKTKAKFPQVQPDHELDISAIDNTSIVSESELPSRISNTSGAISDIVSDATFNNSDFLNQPISRRNKVAFGSEIPISSDTGTSKPYTDTADDMFSSSKPSSRLSDPTPDSCKKKLRFTCGDDNVSSSLGEKSGKAASPKARSHVKFSLFDKPATSSSFKVAGSENPDSSNITDLNVSMTPDLEDCMKLMDDAKRKLDKNRQTVPSVAGSSSLGQAQQYVPARTLHNEVPNFKSQRSQSPTSVHTASFASSLPPRPSAAFKQSANLTEKPDFSKSLGVSYGMSGNSGSSSPSSFSSAYSSNKSASEAAGISQSHTVTGPSSPGGFSVPFSSSKFTSGQLSPSGYSVPNSRMDPAPKILVTGAGSPPSMVPSPLSYTKQSSQPARWAVPSTSGSQSPMSSQNPSIIDQSLASSSVGATMLPSKYLSSSHNAGPSQGTGTLPFTQ